MVGNIELPGSGKTIATDRVGGVDYQRVKISVGGDGAAADAEQSNPLPVGGHLVSTNNSTTATLGVDAVFTGTGEDCSRFSSVSVSGIADESGTLSIEFSSDNTNWDFQEDVDSSPDLAVANHRVKHRGPVFAKFFRVVYTNGGTAQTFFRLQVIFHAINTLPLLSSLKEQLNTSSDCQLIRGMTSVELDLARRQITGQRAHFFNGFNNVLAQTTWEDIHPAGGDINWLTTATKVEVLSTDSADTAGGLGCRAVELHGLSATGVDQKEVIATNGLGAVESSLTYIRVNLHHAELVGTYGGANKGDITCRVTGGGAVLGVMKGLEGAVDTSVQYGSGESENGYFSVPLGKVLYISYHEVKINTQANKTADIALYERDALLDISGDMCPRRLLWSATEVTGNQTKLYRSNLKIKGLTDLWFRAQASGTGTKISIALDHFLMDANDAGE